MISENGCQIILDILCWDGILAVVLILFFGVRFISSKFGNQKQPNRKQGDTAGDGNNDSDAGSRRKHRQQPRNRKQHRQQASWN